MKSLLSAVFLLVFSVVSCISTEEKNKSATQEPEMSKADLKERIQKLEDTLAMAYNQKNLEMFKRFYAEDAVTYGEGREQLFGRKDMVDHFRRQIVEDSVKRDFSYLTIDVFQDCDIAVETGKWIERDDSGEEEDHGFYIVVFRKENGQWVSIRDIWNSSTGSDPEMMEDERNP